MRGGTGSRAIRTPAALGAIRQKNGPSTEDARQHTRYSACYDHSPRGGNLMLVGRTNRRAFIAALGGAAAWPLLTRARRRRP
jgi:hypothetical protein